MPKLEEIPEIKFSRRRDLVVFELLALEFPDALYAFKSRGFGGKIGIKKVVRRTMRLYVLLL